MDIGGAIGSLLQMAPVIGAGFTGDPQTVVNTFNMQQAGQKQAKEANLKKFGEAIMAAAAEGKPMDQQTFYNTGEALGLSMADIMPMMTAFSTFQAQQTAAAKAKQDTIWSNYKRGREMTEHGREDEQRGISDVAMNAYNQARTDDAFDPVAFGWQVAQSGLRDWPEWIDKVMGKDVLRAMRNQPPEDLAKVTVPGPGNKPYTTWMVPEEGKMVESYQKPGDALSITTPDGTSIWKGPAGTAPPASQATKPTTNKLQEQRRNLDDSIVRLQQIYNTYSPEYLTAGGRKRALEIWVKDKTGLYVSPEDRAWFSKYNDFRRIAVEDINLYIKYITGAQMSAQEADRLMLAKADPGLNKWNPFAGDSPQEFLDKLENDMQLIKFASIRNNFYRHRGLDESAMERAVSAGEIQLTPASIGRLMAEQETLLNTKYKAMGFEGKELDGKVLGELEQMFGKW